MLSRDQLPQDSLKLDRFGTGFTSHLLKPESGLTEEFLAFRSALKERRLSSATLVVLSEEVQSAWRTKASGSLSARSTIKFMIQTLLLKRVFDFK